MKFYNLKLKEESLVKKNAANFYFMEKYADQYLNINRLRFAEFDNFNKQDHRSNSQRNTIIKTGVYFAISALLIYKFKSILIVPIFFANYKLVDKFVNYKKENCYFCEKTRLNYENKQIYNSYYKLISQIFERNENIKSLDDFEQELDKIIKELKI